MSHRALIKLARIFDTDILDADWKPAERTLFQRGALKLNRGAPLVVDHDKSQPIGSVLELVDLPDTDGNWLSARCAVEDPPEWLRQGTAASFGYAGLQEQAIGDWRRVLRGLLTGEPHLSRGGQREPWHRHVASRQPPRCRCTGP
jgi:hypothetical protein